ncbi:MAG TPA: sugar ABC transporter, partial [Microbacterium sp.]|nr:sugar ABC transporter [Microbacterium sp.]
MNPRINSTRRRAAATLAVAAGLALVASGCASAEQGGAQSSDDEIVVGYSGYTLTNPYFAGLIKGLEEGAEEHDFRLIQTNSNGDNNTQASDIQNLVSQGADYIVVSPADASAIVPAVEAAAEAGVTMVAISDTIDSDAITFTVA